MARTVRIHLTDDLDGNPADETVLFSLDGVGYEIDLSADHATDLRGTLASYITAGRRTGRGQIATATRVRAPRGAAAVVPDRAQNQAIRDWAKRNGIALSDRGRIPRTVVEQYETAAGR